MYKNYCYSTLHESFWWSGLNSAVHLHNSYNWKAGDINNYLIVLHERFFISKNLK